MRNPPFNASSESQPSPKRQPESEQEYRRRKAVERDRSIRNAQAAYQSALQLQIESATRFESEFRKLFNDLLGK